MTNYCPAHFCTVQIAAVSLFDSWGQAQAGQGWVGPRGDIPSQICAPVPGEPEQVERTTLGESDSLFFSEEENSAGDRQTGPPSTASCPGLAQAGARSQHLNPCVSPR